MSYSTPHHAHEFMKAAALAVVHQFVLACQRKQGAEKRDLLLRKREIDFNARLAMFFGPEASISAQGVKDSDLLIKSPTLEVELKYCRPNANLLQPVNGWTQVIEKDWLWLLRFTAAGDGFKKSAFMVFLPSVELFDFHQCFQVPQSRMQNGLLVPRDYAPFIKLVAPSISHPSRLEYTQQPWERDALLWRSSVGAPVRVRRQIVGHPKQPIWALVCSRIGHKAAKALSHLPEYEF